MRPEGLRKDFEGAHLPSLFEQLLEELPAVCGAALERFRAA